MAEDVLKEDYLAIDTFIAKAVSPISTLDGDLHQSEKASLRNFVIQKSNATINEIQQKASWLIDGLVAV